MSIKRTSIAILAMALILGAMQTEASAQRNLFSSPTSDFYKNTASVNRFTTRRQTQNIFNNALPVNLRNSSRDIFATSPLGSQRSKPFSNVTQSSNLSPYLNIGGLPTGAVPNYHTQVRPQLEQQQQQAQQRRTAQRNQQVQATAARAPYELRGASDIMPTGHAATYQNLSGRFMNYGGYYRLR